MIIGKASGVNPGDKSVVGVPNTPYRRVIALSIFVVVLGELCSLIV